MTKPNKGLGEEFLSLEVETDEIKDNDLYFARKEELEDIDTTDESNYSKMRVK